MSLVRHIAYYVVDVSTDYEYHSLRTRVPESSQVDPDHEVVAGIDGCKAGWVCFIVETESRRTRVEVVSSLHRVICRDPPLKLIAIDVPIGLPEKGARTCDLAARKVLGKPRSNSVFPAPVRATLTAGTYTEACDISRRVHGKAMSRQTFEILSKIREVDALITPELQGRIFEVHPEVSFWTLNGNKPLRYPKSKAEGRDERSALLAPHYPHIEKHLAEFSRAKVGQDDVLDAAAAAWTAERVLNGLVTRQFDRRGLRMEIVY